MNNEGVTLVALSGGADSVCLLLKLLEQNVKVAAAHVNFHLRGEESNRDETFVTALCNRLGVRLFIRHFQTKDEAEKRGESIEMTARALRYEWFAALCHDHGFERVAVAHHKDDNAETILLNLIRGTGIDGLRGMKEESKEFGITVWRPLLALSKNAILDYLSEKQQPFVTDSTNSDTAYRRNKIRNELIPLLAEMNPSIVSTLTQTGFHLADAAEIYHYGVETLKEKCITISPNGERIFISSDKLRCLPSPHTLLYEWLKPLGFTNEQSSQALYMRTGSVSQTAEWLLTRTCEGWEIGKRAFQTIDEEVPITDGIFQTSNGITLFVRIIPYNQLQKISHEQQTATIDLSSIKGKLKIRSVREGDRFQPFGMKGTKLISDYLTDLHFSRLDKRKSLVLTDDEGIVWLVGLRTSERTRISKKTKDILLITYTDTL